jgi:hypothetical protein
VFELLACILNDCELEMFMPKSMRAQLTEVDYTALMESLSQLDCRESEASISEDRERIFGLIQRTVGFDQLNLQMKAKAKEWIRQESAVWLVEVAAHYFFRLVLHPAISLQISMCSVIDLHVLCAEHVQDNSIYQMQETASGAPPVHNGGPSAGSGNVSGGVILPAEDR